VKIRAVHVVKFLPLTFVYGQIQVRRLDLAEFLSNIEHILTKMEQELSEKIGSRRVLDFTIEITPVSLGSVAGLLIVMIALVEDSVDISSQG